MKQKLTGLVRLTLISSVTFSIATVSNFFTHHKYWNFTVFAVQTVDFNILSHSLPTKLSIILEQGKQAEIQRTLDSNYGLFGLVVTDCKTVEVKCANQKVLYSSKSKFRWQQQIGASKLSIHPYDNLRNPPPIFAEGYFASTRDRQRQPTNKTNSGVIIGRVYYVRNQPPTFIQDYTRWIKKPLSFSGVNAIYFLTVSLFMLGGFFAWMIGEQILHQKRVQHKLAQQEKQQLIEKQQQLVNQAQSLQKQLQEKLKQINLLLEQRQQDCSKLEDDRSLQAQQIQQLEKAIALSAIQEAHQRETLQTSQQELLAFQQHEQVVNDQSQRREQIVADLQHQIDQQKLEQQQKSNILEELRRQLENTKVKESATQHQTEVLQQTVNVLTYEKEQITRNSQQLEDSLSQTANIENLTATLELAKIELYQSKQLEELAVNETAQLSYQHEEDQLDIWELQEQVQYYQEQVKYYYDCFTNPAPGYQTTVLSEPQLNGDTNLENIDLSILHLALVGGHPKVRRQVIDELRQNYKLRDYVEIPPSSEVYINRQTIKAQVSRCNLVAVITGHIGHDATVILSALQQDGAINGELLWIENHNRGKSSIVRSILSHIKSDAFRAIAIK